MMMTIVRYTLATIIIILATSQVCRIIENIADEAHRSINEAIDMRVRMIVHEQRLMIYEDLAKLFPSRVKYTRHGMPYVKERE